VKWLAEALDRLSDQPLAAYHSGAPVATESTALAALALIGNGNSEAARVAIDWLLDVQNTDGSVGISATQAQPRWPTGLAALAWMAAGENQPATTRAVDWILEARGKTFARPAAIGHDTTIPGWSWVTGTHNWIEPTAIQLLALKAAGYADHPRTRDGVRMLRNRLLPEGGCNYGNTEVLGQPLRPNLMSTGLALLALASETDDDGRIAKTVQFTDQNIVARTTTLSLSYGLLGLAAHASTPHCAADLLKSSLARTIRRGASPYKLALIALAALGVEAPLVTLPKLATPA
jgi:hypothetical protein